jgi:hypothetical protein
MSILPPCKDHSSRLDSIEKMIGELTVAMQTITILLKENTSTISGTVDVLQQLQQVPTHEIESGEPYHR